MQGTSTITPIKEVQIKGTVLMRLRQRKNQSWINNINVYDVFCGDGENIICDETVQGSPLEICDAINESGMDAAFIASDIKHLSVMALCPMLKAKANTDLFTHKRYSAEKAKATDQMDKIICYLKKSKGNHAIIIVDPNGPGVMPFDKMLYIMKHHSKQADMLINISETAINRILGCHITKDKNWWEKYDSFVEIIWSILATCKCGWIRTPIKGDRQRWRFICCWSFAPPLHNWEKQGLFEVRSKDDLVQMIGVK